MKMKKRNVIGIAAIAFLFAASFGMLGCEQSPASNSAEAEAAAFRADSVVTSVLSLTPEAVTHDDKSAVKTALASYNNLSDGAKALLAKEKAKLDALKAAIPPLWTDASLPEPTDGGYGVRYSASYSHYLEDIAYGGPVGREKYVVVGQWAHIAYSDNGKDWTLVPRALEDVDGVTTQFSSLGRVTGVVYGRDKFVAVGSGNQIAYSIDGMAWHKGSLDLSGFLNGFQYNFDAVAYGGTAGSEKFVAVGQNGAMVYSADGVRWEKVTSSPIRNEIPYGVKYTGGKFIARCHSLIAYSGNGVDWQLMTNTPTSGFTITYGNGKWLGYVLEHEITIPVNNEFKNQVYVLDNIATWSPVSAPVTIFEDNGLCDIEYSGPAGKEKFIVGNGSSISYSSDGVTWTRFTTKYHGLEPKYAGGKYFCIPTLTEASSPSLIYTTPDELD